MTNVLTNVKRMGPYLLLGVIYFGVVNLFQKASNIAEYNKAQATYILNLIPQCPEVRSEVVTVTTISEIHGQMQDESLKYVISRVNHYYPEVKLDPPPIKGEVSTYPEVKVKLI